MIKRVLYRFFVVLVYPFILVLAAGCVNKNSGEYGLDTKETLRINAGTEPPSLDWHQSSDTTSSLIHDNIMEGLVDFDLYSTEPRPIPGLATEWSSDKHSKTFTFTLRKGVKWSDGVDFTAQQVLDGWERLLNPATASTYAYYLYNIKNARAYNEGKMKDFSKVGVKIDETGRIVVELEKPATFFPGMLSHHSTYPVRKELLEKFGNRWTEPKNLVTLGPYTLKIWEHDKAIVLERNDLYWGEKPKIKNVLVYMIGETSTAMNLFDAGRIDVLTSIPSREVSRIKLRPEYKRTPILLSYYFGFNVKKRPTDQLKVRQALSLAIDRKQITEMLGGGETPLWGWIPQGVLGGEAGETGRFDPERASRLLDVAGFKDRKSFPMIEIGINTNEDHRRIAENIQSQLQKNLGIKTEIRNEEWKVYLSSLKVNAPHMFRLGWVADYPDPDSFMTVMNSFSDNNHTGWKNLEYDRLVAEGAESSDPMVRKKVYARAQELLTVTDAVVVPIYSGVGQMLIAKRVENFPLSTLSRKQFKKVWLKDL